MEKKRRYNTNLIKETLNYSANDIADLFKTHKRTPQQWFKEGLPKIDSRKPFLVLGSDLKEFIKNRQGGRKKKCALNELYCCKCRKPQTSWSNLVDIKILNERRLMIMGVCIQCPTQINRLAPIRNLSNIQEIFAVQTILNQDLIGSNPSIVNTDIKKELLV